MAIIFIQTGVVLASSLNGGSGSNIDDDIIIKANSTLVMDVAEMFCNSLWIGYDARFDPNAIIDTGDPWNPSTHSVSSLNSLVVDSSSPDVVNITVSTGGAVIDVPNGISWSGRVFISTKGAITQNAGGENSSIRFRRHPTFNGIGGVRFRQYADTVDRGVLTDMLRVNNLDSITMYNSTFLNGEDSIVLPIPEMVDRADIMDSIRLPIKGGKKEFLRTDGRNSRDIRFEGVYDNETDEFTFPFFVRRMEVFQLENPLESFKLTAPISNFNVLIDRFGYPEEGGQKTVNYSLDLIEV